MWFKGQDPGSNVVDSFIFGSQRRAFDVSSFFPVCVCVCVCVCRCTYVDKEGEYLCQITQGKGWMNSFLCFSNRHLKLSIASRTPVTISLLGLEIMASLQEKVW